MALDPEFAIIPSRYLEAAEPKSPTTKAATLLTPRLAELLKLDDSGAKIVRDMLDAAHTMGRIDGIVQSLEIDHRYGLPANTGGAQ